MMWKIFKKTKGLSENLKDITSKSLIKKSVYIHDYVTWDLSKDCNTRISIGETDYLIEFDFRIETPGARKSKPLYDYDYLIFDSGSQLSKVEISEFKKAVELKIPVIILSGYYSNHLQKGVRSYQDKIIQTCHFFDFISMNLFNIKYHFLSGDGRDAKIENGIFKIWWDYIKNYYLTFEIPPDSKVLAKNNAHFPIAWYKDNFIFIPGFTNRDGINDYQLNKQFREDYFKRIIEFIITFKPEQKLPEWFKNYKIINEAELLKEREKIDEQIEQIKNIKKIIATNGNDLQSSFELILKKLNISWKRYETEDYLIEGETNIVVEITGSKNNLNSEKAIQSLQHEELLSTKLTNLKLCVIINHQKNDDPEKRKSLDQHSIKKYYAPHKICVMSTLTLLKYYEKIINKKITKEDFLQKIVETNGELTNK